MAMTITLVPEATSLTIGDDYPKTNTLKFKIELKGDGPVWLTLEIPVDEVGILHRFEDGNNITLATPGTDPAPKPTTSTDRPQMKVWSLGDSETGIQVKGSCTITISVEISNVLCRAKAGQAQITVIGQFGSLPEEIQEKLTITKAKPKTAPENPICYFTAEPTFLIGEGDVTLRWDVVGDLGVSLGSPNGQIQSPLHSGMKHALAVSGDYTLNVGHHKRQAGVNVLPKGWNELTPWDKKTFPFVLFDSGDRCDDALYAIFVRDEERRGRQAVLCKSTDGITNWHIVNDMVPDGMESSPGLQVGDRLWLIGGSVVDWDQKSKRACYYDLKDPAKGWRDATVTGADGFKERMGHACVVVDRSIWVMGGLGPYACLNDVWKFELDTADRGRLHGSQMKESSEWKPRCLFSAVNFNKSIWVCGGVSSPHGNPLSDLWTSLPTEISWKERGDVVANAIGTGVTGCGDTLFTVLTTRTGGPTWVIATKMSTMQTNGMTSTSDTWTKADAPTLPDDGTHNPRSLSLVGFQPSKKKRLYLRGLQRTAKGVVSTPLFVYIIN
jgi:hypothetical protein